MPLSGPIVDIDDAVLNSDTSTVSMSFVIDEDSMASDSATKVPTQQSVKAYADSKARVLGQWRQTIYTPGSDITTTSTSYADIDSTNLPALSLTLVTGDVVRLELTATWGYSASGNVIGVDWLVDQPVSSDTNTRDGKYGAAALELGTSETDGKTLTVMSSFTATESGAHTFKPQWRRGAAGTAAIRGGGSYHSPVRHRVTNMGPPS